MRICPLCTKPVGFKEVQGPDARNYHHCELCHLIFTDTRVQTTIKDEQIRSRQQAMQGYVTNLNKSIKLALEFLNTDMMGLDYGCGPDPTLNGLLNRDGFKCDVYDSVYFPELDQNIQYDFIFATGCFEYFFFPAKEFQKINSLLKANGILVIMSEKYQSIEKFKSWNYAKDRKRVSFYHRKTWDFIKEKYGFEQLHTEGGYEVSILRKA